jgi:hypothetical protein
MMQKFRNTKILSCAEARPVTQRGISCENSSSLQKYTVDRCLINIADENSQNYFIQNGKTSQYCLYVSCFHLPFSAKSVNGVVVTWNPSKVQLGVRFPLDAYFSPSENDCKTRPSFTSLLTFFFGDVSRSMCKL